MATRTTEPLTGASTADLLKLVADQGYANGLKAAALLLDKMAEQHMRVVGTSTVRDVADALRGKAAEIGGTASQKIAAIEAASK